MALTLGGAYVAMRGGKAPFGGTLEEAPPSASTPLETRTWTQPKPESGMENAPEAEVQRIMFSSSKVSVPLIVREDLEPRDSQPSVAPEPSSSSPITIPNAEPPISLFPGTKSAPLLPIFSKKKPSVDDGKPSTDPAGGGGITPAPASP